MDSSAMNPLRSALAGGAARDALTGGAAGIASDATVTAAQQQQLAKLHQAAQQMESLFVDMLFKEMRKSAPPVSLTGKTSNAEETFGEMLDTKRADELSKSGALGIGKILEQQLRSSVLGQQT
jgi:flagellar protein FlgJ